MAYPQPPSHEARGPMDHEVPRHTWTYQTIGHSPYGHQHTMPPSGPVPRPPDDMDPEQSDSDVSLARVDPYGRPDSPALPATLPPSKHILDSSDAINARLRELNQVEDHNIRKQEMLAAKRRRMDDKIARKREIQERKIKAVYDARQRRDARVAARRARENAAFKAVDDQMEEEETSLRRRLKRLKRGLPPDESPRTGRSISTASTSPPGPPYSTIPPPPKRHQPNPPGQTDGQQTHPVPPPPPLNVPAAPSYSFYQANPKPYSMPYHAAPTYSTVPPPPPPSAVGGPLPPPGDRPPYSVNGRPPSPPRHTLSTIPPVQNTPPAAPSSRQPSSTYDTRPPPTTSGFASINAPATTGFATINSRAAATPPGAHSSLTKPQESANRTPSYGYEDQPPPSSSKQNGNSNTSTPAAGKRTPSTTHPYQMSEAFANRHHHCERVDSLNRGIWTSHGPAGTAESPTGPPVEMYLRCNHDDCRRIDWRTVHGLQCHIVKNHEQPKGTIGSLEKALDRYGVPVKEVEDYEREHGEGTGGTMADPKNLKIKNKTKAAFGRQSTPGSYGVDPMARPAGYKPSPAGSADSPTMSNPGSHYAPAGPAPRGYAYEDIPCSDRSSTTQEPPKHRFESVKGDWHVWSSNTPTRPPVDTSKELQGDAVMRDAPPPPSQGPRQPHSTWRAWGPPTPGTTRPPPSFQTASAPESKTVPNESVQNRQATAPSPAAAPATIPSASGAAGTQTQAVAEEVKKVEPKQDQVESNFGSSIAPTQDADTRMTGVTEENQPPVDAGRKEAVIAADQGAAPDPRKEEGSVEAPEPMDVDGEKKKEDAAEKPVDGEPKDDAAAPASAGPASGTRSAMQSPVMTNKPLNPPGSAKRVSRRSSTARKLSGDSNVDHEGEEAEKDKAKGDAGDEKAEVGEKEEGKDGDEGVEEKDTIRVSLRGERDKEREMAARTPPRRSATGRFTRRRTGQY